MKPAKLLCRLWLLCWLAPPQGECAHASQICFLVPLPPTPELSSLPTQLLYKSKGNILPLLFLPFLNRLDVILCSWAWVGAEGTAVMERRDGFRKNAHGPSEGENSLQLQGTSTSHTLWFTRETQSTLIFKNKIVRKKEREGNGCYPYCWSKEIDITGLWWRSRVSEHLELSDILGCSGGSCNARAILEPLVRIQAAVNSLSHYVERLLTHLYEKKSTLLLLPAKLFTTQCSFPSWLQGSLSEK